MALPIYDNIPELSTEANAIARRRKIAESMMAQSQTPLETNQMAGGYVVPVSWTQGLAKLAQAYLGNKTDEEADKSEQGLADKRQKMVTDALTQFKNTSQGTAGVEGIQAQPERTIQAPAPMQQGQVAPNYGTVPETVPAVAGREAVPAVAPNPRQAIIDASMSNLPEMQKYAAMKQLFDTQDATQAQALAKLESERNKPINVAQGGTIYDPKTGQAIFSAPEKPIASSGLAKLINERNSLPEGSPLRATYDEAIKKETTATEPLVMTVNAQGVPTYTPRGQASGSMPYVPSVDNTDKKIDLKKHETYRKDLASQSAFNSTIDATLNTIDKIIGSEDGKIKKSAGLESAIGSIDTLFPTILQTTKDTEALQKTLLSQASMEGLSTIRSQGGAIGSITEREWPILQNLKATLEASQGTPAYIDNLKEYRRELKRVKNDAKSMFDNEYTDISKSQGSLPKGIPQGAVLTDEYTTDGRQLYKSLDGKYHTAD